MWTNVLTFEKEFLFYVNSDSQFKLFELTDRGEQKYPSEPVLRSAITLWKILDPIVNNDELSTLLVDGPSRAGVLKLGGVKVL